jgi:glycine hydroxymethyltransferase
VTEKILESVGIIVNRNVIPNDPEKPNIASAIRIGSPAMTSRGMGEPEVIKIVELIDAAIVNRENKKTLSQISAEVLSICKEFPITAE